MRWRAATVAVACTALAVGVPAGVSARQGGPPISVSITDAQVVEGPARTTAALVFHVELSAAPNHHVSVSYTTVDGTATSGSDYVHTSGTVRFGRGGSSETIVVDVIGDNRPESDETMYVVLTKARGATIADGTGTGTILDDDSLYTLDVLVTGESASGAFGGEVQARGRVTSDRGGIDCGNLDADAVCSEVYPTGLALALTATPWGRAVCGFAPCGPGNFIGPFGPAYFGGWGGDCAHAGLDRRCELTVDRDLTVTAHFTLDPP